MIFRTTRRIEFCDTDMAGIVHFSNFFRFMESAEVEYLRARGLSVAMDWNGEHIGFPRVAASCEYKSPARFQDLIDVTVTVEKIGQKSVTYGFEFYRNQELLAKGKVTSACCRVLPGHQLEGLEIPADLRERITRET